MSAPSRSAKIVAHRGAWGPEPQNSLAAFRRAMALGVDMIELDIRKTLDGRLVAVHDPKAGTERINRLSFGELRDRLPEAPLLEEVLEVCGGRIVLNLEIKVSGIEAECLGLLKPFQLEAFLITSFHTGVLDAFRRRNPLLATGVVAKRGDATDLAGDCRLAGHRALFLHHALLPAAGALPPDLDLYAWTVNGEADLTAALARGDLVGIVTDEPVRGLALRAAVT